MIRTAEQLRISSLFHYERLNLEYFASSLDRSEIFFSDPRKFNDPWDCQPQFNTDALDQTEFYDRQVRYFDRAGAERFPELSDAERARQIDRLRVDRPMLESWIDRVSTNMCATLGDQYRVYCLSTTPTNPLMWGHYADSHRGICMQFDTANDVFAGALQVQYSRTYPLQDLADDTLESTLSTFICKSDDWAYENEFRLVSQERSCMDGEGTLITDGGRLAIPRDALKSIIVGCLTPESARTELASLIAATRPDVALYEAVKVRNQYRLALRPMAATG